MKKVFFCLIFGFYFLASGVSAQEDILELSVDVNSQTKPLPKIFSPSMDLSGCGSHRDVSWPYHLAAKEVLKKWKDEIGFKATFRLYWNIWELEQAKLDRPLSRELLVNYEKIIKDITESGGTVILSLYGSAPGMGRALDKRSPPSNLKQWKRLIKETIRYLSYEKKYNIWYEVWSAPDTEDYFLGTKRDYLNLYRMVAEAVRELKKEKKINIFVGGPATTWWFQNFDGNTIITPQKSLIYELIRFCFKRKLPLDFISWHAYSTDPQTEKEATSYNKNLSRLIRDWLQYFRFKQDIPLVIDEWNFDNGSNIIKERAEQSYVAASFIPARMKNMHEAGIDYQVFFSLEDFQNNKDGVNTNRGAFYYDLEYTSHKAKPKLLYNVFLMLSALGEQLPIVRLDDQFVGALATRKDDQIIILLWNYIDPFLARNYLSRNIATLSRKNHKNFLSLVKSGQLDKFLEGELALDKIKGTDKLKALLTKAQGLNEQAKSFMENSRSIKINLLNMEGDYLYQRYTIGVSCAIDCKYAPLEEKQIKINGTLQEIRQLNPYSVELMVLKKVEIEKKEKEDVAGAEQEEVPEGELSVQSSDLAED